jgi:hypothetical protein
MKMTTGVRMLLETRGLQEERECASQLIDFSRVITIFHDFSRVFHPIFHPIFQTQGFDFSPVTNFTRHKRARQILRMQKEDFLAKTAKDTRKILLTTNETALAKKRSDAPRSSVLSGR